MSEQDNKPVDGESPAKSGNPQDVKHSLPDESSELLGDGGGKLIDGLMELLPDGLKAMNLPLRPLLFFSYYLGNMGEVMGNKTKSARLAGYKGSSQALNRTARRVLARYRLPMTEYLSACGVSLPEIALKLKQGLGAKDVKVFMHQETGQLVYSKGLLNVSAQRTRNQTAEILLSLLGETTKRVAVSVESVARENRNEDKKGVIDADFEVL